MKKYGFIAGLVLAVIAATVAWNFFRTGDDNMASSIPADATMVGRIDLKKLALDYGLDMNDLKDLFSSAIEGEETGIKAQAVSYFFASQGKFGVIVPLSDEKDFATWLRREGSDIEEQRGMKWVVNGNMIMGFNNDRAIIMGPALGSDQDALRNTIYTCITQKESESGKQGRLYKLLDERNEGIAVSSNGQGFADVTLPHKIDFLPTSLSFGDMDLVAGFSAHKEKLSLNFTISSENPSVNKLLDKFDKALDKIDGSLLRTTPSNALFHLEIGLDGDDLLHLLRENKILRTGLLALNMVVDLDKIIKTVDGDVSFSVLDFDNSAPSFLFQAQLENDNFMKNVAGWNDAGTQALGVNFYAQDKNNAVCTISGTPVYFGTRNKRLSISNVEALVKAEAYTDELKAFASDMRGNRMYGVLNLSKLSAVNPIGGLERIFDRLTFSMTDSREMHLDLTTRQGVDLMKELKKIAEK